MTLRHRLLLVYLIVVLLSIATVGVAIYELNRTQAVYGPLLPQVWDDVGRDAERLKAAFNAMSGPESDVREFEKLWTGEQRKILLASSFIDVDHIRNFYALRLHQAYQYWKTAPPEARAESAALVNQALDGFAEAIETASQRLEEDLERQRARKWTLLAVALGLAGLHVVLIGWLLRRWLLWPMERLNRQVEALARDQAPPEPLLASPLELARLATALDRARESLRAYRIQLVENERLTTIGQFAAQLAHNLRNPLASIRAAAQVTSRRERANEYVAERMSEVIACVDRLNHWIGGLMEIARRDATPARDGDIVPLLHGIEEAVRPEMAIKEVSLSVEAPAEGLVCAHDPVTLEQALIAMVVNAIEASPLGGRIVLRAERVEREKEQGDKGTRGQGEGGMEGRKDGKTESWRDAEKSVCRISVEDEGPGVPAEDPERIFEFSYSTKQKGMGLGLALARLALERQGGQAYACNRPEGGARVYVDLPVSVSDNEEVRGERGPGPGHFSTGRKQ